MSQEIAKRPMIPIPAIGRAVGVGIGAVEATATRLGIVFTKRPNGRSEASFEQAARIVAALEQAQAPRA